MVKKMIWGIPLFVICILGVLFVSCSDQEDIQDIRNDLSTQFVVDFQRGVSVEKDPLYGTYLRFADDSTVIKFSDYIVEHYNDDTEIQKIMKPLYDQGFVSSDMDEKSKNVPLEDRYSGWSWGYLVNENKYFKIGDILYQDDNQKAIYALDASGNKTLVKSLVNDGVKLKSSSDCYQGGKVSQTFSGYPAGVSRGHTLKMETYVQHYVPWTGDQQLILYNDLYSRQPDGTYWSAATATFSQYYSYDLWTASGSDIVNGRKLSTPPGTTTSYKNVIVKSRYICVGYVYVDFKATRADGSFIQGHSGIEKP